ncbi:MAG: anaerobic ribonucleoside-triphosphate reductase [Candidatus Pacearchaeota archaeon]
MTGEKRTKCERFTRVCGYLRPVEMMNEGKQAEVSDRIMFNVAEK